MEKETKKKEQGILMGLIQMFSAGVAISMDITEENVQGKEKAKEKV